MSQSSLHISANLPDSQPIVAARAAPAPARPQGVMQTINGWLARLSPVKTEDKATFFRLLATMINAGISIVKALRILSQQIVNPHFQQIILELARSIEGGKSLSAAMAQHPKLFIGAQIGMVESGEASGRLNQALHQLALDTEKSASLKSKVKGAMLYPVVVIVIMFAAGIAVMTFVMPRIKEMFESLGGELPAVTRGLIAVSDFLAGKTLGVSNVMMIVLGLIGVALLFSAWKKTTMGRYWWARVKISLPIFGPLVRKIALAQFCRSVATLMASGLSIIKVLKITSSSVGNAVYQRRVLQIADDVKQGIPMGENMRDDPLFPSMVVGMIAVAEQTAQIDTITAKLADYYEEEVNDSIKNLSSLIEPLIIVVIGLGVGFLVISVMMPILQSSDLVGAAA